jgi:hypothetical protein
MGLEIEITRQACGGFDAAIGHKSGNKRGRDVCMMEALFEICPHN